MAQVPTSTGRYLRCGAVERGSRWDAGIVGNVILQQLCPRQHVSFATTLRSLPDESCTHLPPLPSLASGPSSARWPAADSSRPRLRVRAAPSFSSERSALSCGQGNRATTS